jgi:hypothetical protein
LKIRILGPFSCARMVATTFAPSTVGRPILVSPAPATSNTSCNSTCWPTLPGKRSTTIVLPALARYCRPPDLTIAYTCYPPSMDKIGRPRRARPPAKIIPNLALLSTRITQDLPEGRQQGTAPGVSVIFCVSPGSGRSPYRIRSLTPTWAGIRTASDVVTIGLSLLSLPSCAKSDVHPCITSLVPLDTL